MATYNYTARSSKGEIIKDSIDGEAEDLVVSKIKDMGYFIVNITKLKEDKYAICMEFKRLWIYR